MAGRSLGLGHNFVWNAPKFRSQRNLGGKGPNFAEFRSNRAQISRNKVAKIANETRVWGKGRRVRLGGGSGRQDAQGMKAEDQRPPSPSPGQVCRGSEADYMEMAHRGEHRAAHTRTVCAVPARPAMQQPHVSSSLLRGAAIACGTVGVVGTAGSTPRPLLVAGRRPRQAVAGRGRPRQAAEAVAGRGRPWQAVAGRGS